MELLSKVLLSIRALILFIVKPLGWLPPTATRLTLGMLFLQTGWGKLHNLEHVGEFFMKLQIPAPYFQAHIVAITEFVCGGLLVLGLFTRVASLPPVLIMVVALFTAKRTTIAHFGDIFDLAEYLYIVLFLWLVVTGPGPLSVDRLLTKKLERHRVD